MSVWKVSENHCGLTYVKVTCQLFQIIKHEQKRKVCILKRCGIDISSIAEDQLSVHASKKCKTKEVSVMVETESLCSLCTSLWKVWR